MENLFPILNDLSVISFDLIIFTRMISLKRDTFLNRIIMYVGCFLIIGAYFIATYIFKWPAAVSSMLLMSIPSLILFFFLSKHKDSRFFMTFCFVDSISLIIAFLGRYVGIITSQTVTLLSLLVTVALFLAILILGKDYFKRYHELLEVTGAGWREMAVSLALIYFALVFFASYPKPMITRLEYAPVYLVFSAVVISCYVVFAKSIIKTRHIYEQNKRLEHEKEIFQIAYRDSLTGLANRASYVERVNRLERSRKREESIGCLMFDLNNLKHINDTLGHHAGDTALRSAAEALKRVFGREGSYLFRLGGDEFCVLMTGCTEQETAECLANVRAELEAESKKAGFPISMAAGCDMLKCDEKDTVEAALMRADYKMYEDKRRQKCYRPE